MFFRGTARNHPEDPNDVIDPSIPGNTNDPNWFYYWNQVYGNEETTQYKEHGPAIFTSAHPNFIFINDDPWEGVTNNMGILKKTNDDPLKAGDRKHYNGNKGNDESGLKAFKGLVDHERIHRQRYSHDQNYPNHLDHDNDDLHDHFEIRIHSDPHDAISIDIHYNSLEDNEARAQIKQTKKYETASINDDWSFEGPFRGNFPKD